MYYNSENIFFKYYLTTVVATSDPMTSKTQLTKSNLKSK